MTLLSGQNDLTPEIPGYRITRELGGGHWSRVFLATQLSLNRPVAIKLLTSDSENVHARFEREADVMATISHPNIVSIIDRGRFEENYFIVMEYLDGGSLRDHMTHSKPLDVLKTRRVLASVATALTSLHSKGMIHRDIKPDNVLFDQDGQIKICDMGISVLPGQLGQITDEDASPGTLDYMAPEQRYRLDVSDKSDQFALAVMAYEMLTGSLPPRIYRAASELNRALSQDVDAVLERALQEKPEARYPSIAILVESLDAKLASGIVPSSLARSARSRGRSYALPVVLMVACAALLGRHFLGDGWQQTVASQPKDTPISGATRSSDTSSPTIEQTGALPFRLNDSGDIEVLIVQARSGKHWTIPKATQKMRRSLETTAEEEAYEEGGVRGAAVPVVLGNYDYHRDGKTYRVSVVPVRTSEEAATWPEEFRRREWCSISDVGSKIASRDLQRIVESFSLETLTAAAERTRQ